MMDGLFVFGLQHSFGSVAAAVAICGLGGWLVTSLVRECEAAAGPRRHWWFAGLTAVAGVAVWTTHFVAMLGYRPDAFLVYDPATTAVSALVAILAVGLPLALSTQTRRTFARLALGLAAGAGIAAMHESGMAAVEGCIRVNSAESTLLSALVGAAFLGLYRAGPGRAGRMRGALLFVLAVCGAHFTSLAGTRIHPLLASDGSEENLVLGLAALVGTLVLFAVAAFVLMATRRFQAQEKAHAIVLSTALDNMANGLVYFDAGRRLQLFNRRYLEIFGLESAELRQGMTPAEVIDAVGDAKNWSAERRAVARSRAGEWMGAADFTTFDYPMDDDRIMEVEIRPVASGGSVLTFDDVTERRRAQTRIEELAFKDPLTGLANRRALSQRMEADIGSKQRFKLLLIDLDRFKSVNDTHGHGVGDMLLVKVAERIRGVVSRDSFVARLGGDEMAVLVYGDRDLARSVADGIVLVLARPFSLGSVTVSIGCSVGLCCTDDAGEGAEQLMQRTDIALYEAKRQGRGRTVCYLPGMMEAVTERHRLEGDLAEAIETEGFHLAYQPVVDLRSGEPFGYEALIRWEHPARGTVSPAAFVPLAEETGQIVAIGAWVLMEACRAAAAWPDGRHVAVNVSPVQLRSPLFLAHVTAALAASGLAPSRLEVELTETAIVESGTQIADALRALRTLGLRIAMDDFGTGYSSLAHLRDFPLDRIKIDRSFVAAAETDRHSMAVLKAVTQIGRDIGIPTLAEGIETPSQRDLLRALGCDAGQGYLFGRPERLAEPGAALALAG